MEPNRVFPAFCFPWSEKIPTLGRNLALISVLYFSERPEMTSHGEKSKKAKTRKEIKIMNNIKRISLMTAIFLTVALVSSAVEAGVIRINGTIAGSESVAPFPNPAEGIYVNGSVMSTDTALGPFTLFYSLVVDFAFAGYATRPPRGKSFDSGRRRKR